MLGGWITCRPMKSGVILIILIVFRQSTLRDITEPPVYADGLLEVLY